MHVNRRRDFLCEEISDLPRDNHRPPPLDALCRHASSIAPLASLAERFLYPRGNYNIIIIAIVVAVVFRDLSRKRTYYVLRV